MSQLKSGLDWYVALVPPGLEQKAEKHLLAAGFSETFCPRREVSHIIRGRRLEQLRAVFSGYVLCRTDLFTPDLWHLACPDSWHLACSAEGRQHHGLIRSFIGAWPADPVPESCVDDLRSRCSAEGIIQLPPDSEFIIPYKPGDCLVVTEGLWQGHTGIVHRAFFHGVWMTLQTTGYLLYISLEQVGPSNERPKKLLRFRLPSNVRRGPYGQRSALA